MWPWHRIKFDNNLGFEGYLGSVINSATDFMNETAQYVALSNSSPSQSPNDEIVVDGEVVWQGEEERIED